MSSKIFALTIGRARAKTIDAAAGNDAGDFVYEPAFPLPAGDFAVIPSPPTHSIGEGNLDELMDHLNRSGEKWDPTDPDGGVTLRVVFPQEYDDIPLHFRTLDGFDTPIDAVNAGLDFFNAQKQAYALAALQAWADMANVRFEVVDPGEDADIYFYGRDFNDGGAFSSGIDAVHGSRIAINVADGWPSMQPGATSFRMLMHEIGHSLGLQPSRATTTSATTPATTGTPNTSRTPRCTRSCPTIPAPTRASTPAAIIRAGSRRARTTPTSSRSSTVPTGRPATATAPMATTPGESAISTISPTTAAPASSIRRC